MLGLIRDCRPVRSWSAVHLIISAKTEIPNQGNKGKNKGSRTLIIFMKICNLLTSFGSVRGTLRYDPSNKTSEKYFHVINIYGSCS